MSIVDSDEDLELAKVRLSDASDVSLTTDLQFWTVAAYDTSDRYQDIQRQVDAVRRQHHEANTWVGLITQEIRRRRDSRQTPVVPEG